MLKKPLQFITGVRQLLYICFCLFGARLNWSPPLGRSDEPAYVADRVLFVGADTLLVDLEMGVPLLFLRLHILAGLNAQSVDDIDTVEAFRPDNGS